MEIPGSRLGHYFDLRAARFGVFRAVVGGGNPELRNGINAGINHHGPAAGTLIDIVGAVYFPILDVDREAVKRDGRGGVRTH